ncbi:MAG TPA: aldo/keto reductase [Candidatus Acidoferrum sp.]|jgi:aryl-alcohol dehydrogenase-like predicted oxidoreductase|nr:aldo/keto reductase [Candidatus Acidoferrum sp.]
MKYTKLGRTGFDVSRLGFGTWQIGGGRWKAMSDSDNIKLLRSAVERGINIFDAAYVYGQYRNENAVLESRSLELLGKALGEPGFCDSTFICLKIGQLDEFSHAADYSPRRLVENFKHSLALLRRKVVDICLIHAPSLAEVEQGRALAVLETLKGLGLAKAIGYSFENDPEHVAIALRQPIDALMLQYNLIDDECASVLDDAWRQSVGVLVGGPYKRGYLSGRYRRMEDFSPEDCYWEWNLKHNRGKVNAVLNKVNDLLNKAGGARELRHMALEHIFQKPAIGSVIVGHREESEVADNADIVEHLNDTP